MLALKPALRADGPRWAAPWLSMGADYTPPSAPVSTGGEAGERVPAGQRRPSSFSFRERLFGSMPRISAARATEPPASARAAST